MRLFPTRPSFPISRRVTGHLRPTPTVQPFSRPPPSPRAQRHPSKWNASTSPPSFSGRRSFITSTTPTPVASWPARQRASYALALYGTAGLSLLVFLGWEQAEPRLGEDPDEVLEKLAFMASLEKAFTLSRENWEQGRYWTVVTSALANRLAGDLVVNLGVFLAVGGVLARTAGTGRMVLVAGGSAVVGALASVLEERDRRGRREPVGSHRMDAAVGEQIEEFQKEAMEPVFRVHVDVAKVEIEPHSEEEREEYVRRLEKLASESLASGDIVETIAAYYRAIRATPDEEEQRKLVERYSRQHGPPVLFAIRNVLEMDGSFTNLITTPGLFPSNEALAAHLAQKLEEGHGDGDWDDYGLDNIEVSSGVENPGFPQLASVRLGGRGMVEGLVMATMMMSPTARLGLLGGALTPQMWLFASAFFAFDLWQFVRRAKASGEEEIDMEWREIPRAYAAHLGGAGLGLVYGMLRLRGRF